MSLRYNLAGYRPSKTAQQTRSSPEYSSGLSKSHIFQRVVLQGCLAAPTYSRQSKNMKTISTCSKAPRGLFVHVEVGRVFTAIAISPSKSSRQLLARYAIHAGQNSPGKELRLKPSSCKQDCEHFSKNEGVPAYRYAVGTISSLIEAFTSKKV